MLSVITQAAEMFREHSDYVIAERQAAAAALIWALVVASETITRGPSLRSSSLRFMPDARDSSP
jgi:hypothetical protein